MKNTLAIPADYAKPIERGLSIRQPWAWLIVKGFKLVENRSWNTPYRGPVLIHASTSKAAIEGTEELLLDAHPAIEPLLQRPQKKDMALTFEFGKAIGAATIVGVVNYCPNNGDDFEACCRDQGFGAWYDAARESTGIDPGYFASGTECLLLENPVQFLQPFEMLGKLNLFKLDASLQAATAAAAAHLGDGVDAWHAAVEAKAAALRAIEKTNAKGRPGK